MKAVLRRTLSFLIIVAILVTGVSFVEAMESEIMPRVSAYFSYLEWDLTPIGNGDLQVYAEAYATGTMKKLGVKSIALYEKLPDAISFTMVHSYNQYNSPNALRTNATGHIFDPVYTEGVAGAQYYISIAFYAENSSGSETLYRSSPIVTAR